jgi:hypothetical protein
VLENGKQEVICAGCSCRWELSAFPIEFLAGFILMSMGLEELEANSKINNIRDLYRGINDLKKG